MVENSLLKKANESERNSAYADCLASLSDISVGNMDVVQSNIDRVLRKAESKAKNLYTSLKVVPFSEQEKTPLTYQKDVISIAPEELPPIVSLTTISTRMDRVGQTVETILKQSRAAHSINLYISSEPYLVDEGVGKKNIYLKEISEMGVNIYYVDNIGPYRKQIPLIVQLRQSGAKDITPFITIDDDVLYPSNIIESLISEDDYLCSVVAHRGRRIMFNQGKMSAYRDFPIPDTDASYLNLGTGKNGIAYRLGYFPNDAALYVGPYLSPTADDIWCKWVNGYYCIPTKILEPNAAYNPDLDFLESKPDDKRGLFHSYNARGTNDMAMRNLELYFAWKYLNMSSLLGDVHV